MQISKLEKLSSIAHRYDVLLCDVWGVIHDGITVFESASDALARFRDKGGIVVLVTNSPRSNIGVIDQLDKLGVSDDIYDAVVTSGDTTRRLAISPDAQPVFHIGAAADLALIDDWPVELSGDPNSSASILCTGFRRPRTEVKEDYADLLQTFISRSRTMICANPDLMVWRGDVCEPCAGALAAYYRELGGTARYTGKPHSDIYDLALRRVTEKTGKVPRRNKVLAIGDSPRTDIEGAVRAGFDSLLVLDLQSRNAAIRSGNIDTLPDYLASDLVNLGVKANGWALQLLW